MEGDIIPPTDHITRLCFGKAVDGETILGAAFLLRPQKDHYLSVNWLEYLKCSDRVSEIAEIRRRYSRFNLKKNDRIAILNVGITCLKVASNTNDNRCLKATHEPLTEDDSHSGLWGYSSNDILIAELICQSVLYSVPVIENP